MWKILSRFTIVDWIWVSLWLAIWSSLLRLTEWPDYAIEMAVLHYASCLVPAVAIYGVRRGQPFAWGIVALVVWCGIFFMMLTSAGARE
jgi:hypothetical protein